MQGMRLKTLVVCLAATLPIITHAYTPSATVQGVGGTYTSGWAEGLIPVYMNNQQLIYSDLQFEGNSTNSGILSAGSGYRQQINSNGIAGAYLFYDRERSASESYYNVISSGNVINVTAATPTGISDPSGTVTQEDNTINLSTG